ncbi:MAG TPA: hypothetical protein VIS06_11025 [Mycobacteriales bacterium]
MVRVLTKFDPSELDEDGLLQAMVESQQIVAAAQARQVKAMAELTRGVRARSGTRLGSSSPTRSPWNCA